MFFICDCGNSTYALGEDCPHCGKKITDERLFKKNEDAEPTRLDKKQMRLFEEC